MKRKTLYTLLFAILVPLIAKAQELPKELWKIKYFSSEETSGEKTNGRASQIIDGDLSTYWHSNWTGTPSASLPHEIQIDLGDLCSITGIKLWPRQNHCNGKPVKYEYYISTDGKNWGTPVSSGSFSWNSDTENAPQIVSFDEKRGRYIRFRQLSTYSCGSPGIGCIAEIAVTGRYSTPEVLYSAKALEQPSGFISPNSSDNIILPVQIEVYDSKPLHLTKINISTTGTTDLKDISEINIYCTGASQEFNTSNRLGSSKLPAENVEATGDILLEQGFNYVWITYNVPGTAKTANYLDALVNSITVSETVITPSVTNPDGNRMIMGVELSEYPADKQLYPRDKTTNLAQVAFAGTVTDGNRSTTEVKIAVYRDETPVGNISVPLTYKGDIAEFSTDYSLKAELNNYTFEIYSVSDGKATLVRTAKEVVAGDAYIITGQSNAVATIWWGETTTEMENPYIRTFGSAVATGAYTKAWFKAVTHDPLGSAGNGDACDGQVGVLGLSIGRQLVDAYKVPIAIINGAHGGKEIAFFAKNKSNPSDISSNYGRLLTRLNESGLKDDIKAIIWYQGENDGTLGTSMNSYITSFTELHSSWKNDLQGVKKIYVFQIKQGCGAAAEKVNAIQEAHRKLPYLFDDVKTMSTNPIAQQEGCHFPKAGYITHATNILRLIKADLYGSRDKTGIDAPDIVKAELTKPNEITITTTCDGNLSWDSGSQNYFKLNNTSVSINGGRAAGNAIILTTSSQFTSVDGVKLSYLGVSAAGSPAVKNEKGVGMLCFNQATIDKIKQVITFNTLPDAGIGDGDITPDATTSSGLTVSYRSSDPTIASIVNDKIRIIKEGSVVITASQSGNNLYQAAEEVSRNMNILSTGVEEVQSCSYNIYPNPADQYLNLDSGTPVENAEITTASGQKIKIQTIENSSGGFKIDVSALAPGVYFLSFRNNKEGLVSVKFIKR